MLGLTSIELISVDGAATTLEIEANRTAKVWIFAMIIVDGGYPRT